MIWYDCPDGCRWQIGADLVLFRSNGIPHIADGVACPRHSLYCKRVR